MAARKARLTVVATAVLALLAACGDSDSVTETDSSAEPTSETEQLDLTLGGTSSSSGTFAFLESHMRMAGDDDGAMRIVQRETGGGQENMQLVRDGVADLGIVGLDAAAQAQQGSGEYAGQAIPELRNLMNMSQSGLFLIVRADAGVDTLEDLAGKSFAPGALGQSTYDRVANWLDLLDIDVELFDGDLEFNINAMKDNRIVGLAKSASGLNADASMLDIASATDVKILSFSDEHVKKIQEADPSIGFTTVPADTLPGSDEAVVPLTFISYVVHEDMPEDTAYRLAKALWNTLGPAGEQTNFGGAAAIVDQGPATTLDTADVMPIHPGAQRFFEEIG